MVALDEGALICDFAETYHILDYRALPATQAATLASGLRENSRIKMKMAGVQHPIDVLLLAGAVDRLSLLLWAQTKDGGKGRNRPDSVFAALTEQTKNNNGNVIPFESGREFEIKWRELTNRGGSYGNTISQSICANHPVCARYQRETHPGAGR